MKIKLVFNDWQDDEFNSVYTTEEGIQLSWNNFHSGTTFDGTIELDEGDYRELKTAIEGGFRPIFEIILPE